MKTALLLFATITVVAGGYLLLDNLFVFQSMFQDGIFNTNYSALGLPLVMFALSAFFYTLYKHTAKSMEKEQTLQNA